MTATELFAVRSGLPDLAFYYHKGRMQFTKRSVRLLRAHLRDCSDSEVVSIHLAPLPAMVTYPALKWQKFLPEPNSERATNRFVQQVNWLKDQLELPVILENMPTLHPTRYRFESEPSTITQVLKTTGCALLLDLAHTRIAAEARNISAQEYLSQLPIHLTHQIHMAGVRRDPHTGLLFDAHQSLTNEDYDLLAWVLEQCYPQMLTLEYFREDPEALSTQLNQLGQWV